MATLLSDLPETITPTAADSRLAGESSRRLAKILSRRRKKAVPFPIRIKPDDESEETVEIPVSAFRLLADILTQMAQGNAVSLIPIHTELTTQQAAGLLNVSRPFLIDQLERGTIPFRKVGSHRRVRFGDLMKYKHRIDRDRLKALEELSALDQKLGLGY